LQYKIPGTSLKHRTAKLFVRIISNFRRRWA